MLPGEIPATDAGRTGLPRVESEHSASEAGSGPVKDAENYATELRDWSNFDVPYIESSALSGDNINTIFEKLAEEIENEKGTQEGF